MVPEELDDLKFVDVTEDQYEVFGQNKGARVSRKSRREKNRRKQKKKKI